MHIVHDNPAFQARYVQNMRLLREFPWLWGVRQRWQFVYDHLSVSKPNVALRTFLYDPTPEQSIELWVYLEHILIQDSIELVEYREHTPLYAHRIRDYATRRSGHDIKYLVLVTRVVGGDGLVLPDHTKACVYRPLKKDKYLDSFVYTPPATVLI